MTTDQAFIEARNLVEKLDKLGEVIQNVTVFDVGLNDGYAASFHDEEALHKLNTEWEYWFEAADEFPRTAHGATVGEAIEKAIIKTRAEFQKNFRYQTI